MSDKEKIEDELEIAGILKAFYMNKKKLWCWQNVSNGDKRPVHFCLIQKVDVLKKNFRIRPTNKDGFTFDKDQPIFIFSKERNVAFSLNILEYDKFTFLLPIPEKVIQLDDEYITKLEIVEKEDEESNLHKRSHERKIITKERRVGLRKLQDDGQWSTLILHKLYDMSKGGLGIIVKDPAEFKIGTKVIIQSIDGKELPNEYNGTIVSIRQIEDSEDTFKVGIKFE